MDVESVQLWQRGFEIEFIMAQFLNDNFISIATIRLGLI